MRLFVKNLLFTIFMPGTFIVLVPLWLASGRSPSCWSWLGLVPLALGAAIYFHCMWDFAVKGRGTPAPIDPPRTLVVSGLFRCVRNPMYVGIILVLAGWAILFTSVRVLLYATGAALFVHLFIVFYEEPTLRRRFGASYQDYCRHVRRWLPGRPYDKL